jgi:YVTN family beta-propeller protein
MRKSFSIGISLLLVAGVAACGATNTSTGPTTTPSKSMPAPSSDPTPTPSTSPSAVVTTIPGMPEVADSSDMYSADRPNELSPVVVDFPTRVYVPNTLSNTVSVIDPTTYKVLETVKVGKEPQHVVPSWDLKTLWVNNDLGNSLTPIDPATGKFGQPVKVHDPYNLYFTPDGKHAVVMASADRQLVFRDPHTMAIDKVVSAPCDGVNHADWSMDGSTFVVSCEFSGSLLLVDTVNMEVLKVAKVPRDHMKMSNVHHTPMPQDVKISPDGKTYYIADMMSDGIWVMSSDPAKFGQFTFIPTGKGTHGLYVTRDSKELVISNREEGSISLLRFSDNAIVNKWVIPGGGSPDMGSISADGQYFWVSGRYDGVVYVIRLLDGKLMAKIKVGQGPHGLTFYPQPGRYSLGHTGILR